MSHSHLATRSQRLVSLGLLATATLTLTACEPENPCEGVDIIPASQTFIGYGTTEHSEFDDEVVLKVEHGPQGGQHIYGAVLLTGMNPGERAFSDPRGCGQAEVYDHISIIYTISYPDELYPDVVANFGMWLEDGTPEEALGGSLQLVMDIWSVMAAYPDQLEIPMDAHVAVTDACGTTAEDSGSFMLSLDE
jgi:hypothetical protein